MFFNNSTNSYFFLLENYLLTSTMDTNPMNIHRNTVIRGKRTTGTGKSGRNRPESRFSKITNRQFKKQHTLIKKNKQNKKWGEGG